MKRNMNIWKGITIIIACLLMLVTPIGISQPISEKNIEEYKEEPTDCYLDCKIQVLGNIVEYEIIYSQYSWGNLYIEVYRTTLFIEGFTYSPFSLIIRKFPGLVWTYHGDVKVEMDYFFGILYLGENITFCRGRVSTLRVEEI